MISLPNDTVLLLIDVQQAFNNPAWGARNNPNAEANIAILLAAWRAQGMPVCHVHHISKRPTSHFYLDKPGTVVKDEAAPLSGEPIFQKSVNSAFIGTDLEAHLRAHGATTLVLAGITTDHCVSTSARMAGNFGFNTFVVSDATATFERTGPDGRHWTAEVMHDTALASLNKEFATIVFTSDILESVAPQREALDLEAAVAENAHA